VAKNIIYSKIVSATITDEESYVISLYHTIIPPIILLLIETNAITHINVTENHKISFPAETPHNTEHLNLKKTVYGMEYHHLK
jgi:hypothetical protein